MFKILSLASLAALAYSQGLNSCLYKIGVAELDLRPYQGYIFVFNGNDGNYFYSPCENQLKCERNGVYRTAMMDYFRDGGDECFVTANYNPDVQPKYDPFTATFFFNYTSEDLCPDENLPQTNRSSLIAYTCNEDATRPVIVDVNHYDSCNDYVQMEFVGACAPPPPPNEECIFRDAGRVLNLTTIQARNLKYVDEQNEHTLLYSPCANNFKCNTPYGSLQNMVEVLDDGGQCLKFLGVWSGDVAAYYDRTVFGQDYWEFFFLNGQQCDDGGPNEILNVRYYCNPNQTNTDIISFGPAGPPCQYRLEIESPLACT